MGKRSHNSADGRKSPGIIPGFLVAASDFHIGKHNSVMPGDQEVMQAYETAISRAQHVVYIGDIYELLDLQQCHGKDNETVVRDAMNAAIADLDRKILENPDRIIHLVLGNHENLEEFRQKLDALQEKHARLNGNFEWHPEAIKIGNALFTHGDLHLDHPAARRGNAIRTRKAAHGLKEEGARPTKPLIQDPRKHPGYAAPHIYAELNLRADFGSAYRKAEDIDKDKLMPYSENGKGKIFDNAAWNQIEHVFFGHTHLPFSGFAVNDKQFHNTGSAKASHIRSPVDLSFIAGEIDAAGRLDRLIPYGAYQGLSSAGREEYDPSVRRSRHIHRLIAEGYAAGLSDSTPPKR